MSCRKFIFNLKQQWRMWTRFCHLALSLSCATSQTCHCIECDTDAMRCNATWCVLMIRLKQLPLLINSISVFWKWNSVSWWWHVQSDCVEIGKHAHRFLFIYIHIHRPKFLVLNLVCGCVCVWQSLAINRTSNKKGINENGGDFTIIGQ